ncbi:glycosyltransferase [Roseobacter sp. HKCCA0434]|uniref:glycosyltransferase n=1 Tax=Roseobacter sp. HKCCA0434 TaxID=3079297 RepID=UPI0029058733|nr:glycosyltransferase [Roseobacter sp. HKCCA0434]
MLRGLLKRNADLRVLGLIRFSYMGQGGYRLHDDPTIRRRVLYDPARLDMRFDLFEQVCLPGLRAQEDADFRVALLVGDDFPQRDRLDALVADVPQIEVVALPPLPHREACHLAMKRVGAGPGWHIQFRLDDDDAVAIDYVGTVRQLLSRHIDHAGRVALSFARGVYAEERAGQVSYHARHSPYHSAGLAMLHRGAGSVMNVAHHKVQIRMSSICDVRPWMYLRTIHRLNDSIGGVPGGFEPEEQVSAPMLKARFGIDHAALEAAMARARAAAPTDAEINPQARRHDAD